MRAAEARRDSYEADKAATVQEMTENFLSFKAETVSELTRVESQIKPESYFKDRRDKLDLRAKALKNTKCKECGADKDHASKMILVKDEYAYKDEVSKNEAAKSQMAQLSARLKSLSAKYERDIERESDKENPYLERVLALKKETNPYSPGKISAELVAAQHNLAAIEDGIATLVEEIDDADSLLEIIDRLRAVLIQNTIVRVQDRTNGLLYSHFDAEMRIELSIEGADKLEVSIFKDGNSASFTQLSKGQRHLLRLCFGVSIMHEVSHYSGVDLNVVFLDEVAEGLDEYMKSKVFGLLQEMATKYESVCAIDHSEALKAMFATRYEVKLLEGASTVEKAR